MNFFKNYYPILLALYYPLSFFSYNMNEAFLWRMFLPLGLVAVFAVVVMALCAYLFKDRDKTNVFCAIFFFMFFSYGDFRNLVNTALDYPEFFRQRYTLLAGFFLIIFVFIFIKRVAADLRGLSKFLSFVSIVLLILAAGNIVRFGISHARPTTNLAPHDQFSKTNDEPQNLPDIYFILPDGYPGKATLELNQYDNGEFLNFLKKTGFYVAENSHSNYKETIPTLASMFNLNYLNDYTDTYNSVKEIEENFVIKKLKSLGYTYIHFDSGLVISDFNKNADYWYSPKLSKFFDRFLYKFLQTTALRPFVQFELKFSFLKSSRERAKERVDLAFEAGGNLSEEIPEYPKFVFMYILFPHSPYIYGAGGENLPFIKNPTREERVGLYLGQITYANKKLKEMISNILEKSSRPTVILLQSDHGAEFNKDTEQLDPKTGKRLAFDNFTAFYFTNRDYADISDTISNVNSFRVIFNKYFGGEYELLPNKKLRNTQPESGKFVEITDH